MWLIGMMGSGKTTVGRKAATRLGVPFYDTDQMVVEMARMPIDAIWAGVGEDGFRELERRAVADVPPEPLIAAAGGGAVIDSNNRRHMAANGPIIWLRCTPGVLAERVSRDGARPLLADEPAQERLEAILGQRGELYAETATDVIDTDALDVEETVSAVVEIWER